MNLLLSFTIAGLITGTAYAGAACGLILIHKTTRIFNLAHGAIGMVMAFVYWQLTVGWGLPVWLALPLVLLVLAPAFGVVIERSVTKGLGSAPVAIALVMTAALFVVLIGLAQVFWPPGARTVPFFFGNAGLRIGEVFLAYHGLMAIVVVAGVATGMWLMITRSQLGAMLRASVHDPELLALYGGSPQRASMLAWALGASVSSLAGILLAPLLSVDYYELALVVLSAFAAALFGRLTSMRNAFIGAMILGLLQSYAVGYLPAGEITVGVRAAIPALMLLAILASRSVAWPAERPRTAWSASTVPPRVPTLRRSLEAGAVVIAAASVAALVLDTSATIMVSEMFCYGIVMLSLVLLTGYGGHVSLAQLTFVGIGAVTATRFAGVAPLAMLSAAVVAAAVGALVVLLVSWRSVLFLAIATLAFGLLMDRLLFQLPVLFGPDGRLGSGQAHGGEGFHLVLAAGCFVLLAIGLLAVRRGRIGRLLIAVRDDPVACATLGLDPRRIRVALFAASAGMAGLAGGLMAGLRPTVVATEYHVLASLPLLALAVLCGVTSATGALAGGTLMMLLPEFQSAFPALDGLALLIIGVGAIVLGRDLNGLATLAFRVGHWVRRGQVTEAATERPATDLAPSATPAAPASAKTAAPAAVGPAASATSAASAASTAPASTGVAVSGTA